MKKLLEAFIANKNAKTATRISVYIDKHPMAQCLMSMEDLKILKEAEMLRFG